MHIDSRPRWLTVGCALALLVVAASPAAAIPIGGLQLWLQADNGPIVSGSTVTSWTDQSAGGHNASSVGSTPTLSAGVINGLPAVTFDGDASADRMYLPTAITTDPDQFTIFAVVRQDAGDTTQDHIFTHRNSGTQLIQASIRGTDAMLQMRGSGNVLVNHIAPGVVNGAFNVLMFQFDVVNDLHAIAVNGAAEVVNTHDFSVETFIADSQRIGYFFSGGASGGFLNGDIAEVLVYEGRSLGFIEKQLVGYYLSDKYAIQTGYENIPEPCTLALLSLGGAGAVLRRRRRHQG